MFFELYSFDKEIIKSKKYYEKHIRFSYLYIFKQHLIRRKTSRKIVNNIFNFTNI